MRPLQACGAMVVGEATNMAAASVERVERGALVEAAADGVAKVKCSLEPRTDSNKLR